MKAAGKRRELAPLRWTGRSLRLLDQLALPARTRWIKCDTTSQVAKAIREMRVRGAPAIGIAAAYGMALAARARGAGSPLRRLKHAGRSLIRTRPTAVNLAWAVQRTLRAARAASGLGPSGIRDKVAREARAIESEDLASNREIGRLGAPLLGRQARVLTHCNTGALATAGYGTALGVIRTARAQGRIRRVLACETRPYLQGARLTAWELKREGIPFVLITDGMAGYFMQRGEVSAVIVGADRITASGDVANKIGTYGLARLARAHGIPFLVAAPTSTIDLATRRWKDIPIEERSPREVLYVGETRIAPPGVKAAHPAFDVTPAGFVTAIITERGVARPPYGAALRALVRSKAGAAPQR